MSRDISHFDGNLPPDPPGTAEADAVRRVQDLLTSLGHPDEAVMRVLLPLNDLLQGGEQDRPFGRAQFDEVRRFIQASLEDALGGAPESMGPASLVLTDQILRHLANGARHSFKFKGYSRTAADLDMPESTARSHIHALKRRFRVAGPGAFDRLKKSAHGLPPSSPLLMHIRRFLESNQLEEVLSKRRSQQ